VVIRRRAGRHLDDFAEYLGYFFVFSPDQVQYVAAGVIITVALFNYYGITTAAALNTTTLAKYGALALLVGLAFVAGDGSAEHFTSRPAAWASRGDGVDRDHVDVRWLGRPGLSAGR
jgi:amino acid transporter